MINLTCIPAQHGIFKNKKDIFKYWESGADFYCKNFVCPDFGRLFNKNKVLKSKYEKVEIKYDENKKPAVIDIKNNKLL